MCRKLLISKEMAGEYGRTDCGTLRTDEGSAEEENR